ncbi:ABC transporter ATP-binding protein [Spirochaetia bacterium]|nr:ABC transporter ATP-binding protein [Spirochaetia bacterium]
MGKSNFKADTEVDVELTEISKNYGDFRAVDNFSLSVPRGSFTTLLGPSGCGKTTLLRIIAGFFDPDAGTVVICGQNQHGIPPEKRTTGIVFQDYALFPHMTARENLAYGLKIRKIAADTRNREIVRTAEALDLAGLLDRYPGELSGGQQQRLALGRAVILKPQILLMDEPLSNLDAKLRVRVREELKDIQRRLGITTIYVTHDQEEALSLSDYIAVMNNGRLEQVGTPQEVYNTPATAFAADFTGPANFIDHNGKKYLVRPEWIRVNESPGIIDSITAGVSNIAARLGASSGPRFMLAGKITGADFLGRVTRVRLELDTQSPPPDDAAPIIADIPAMEDSGTLKMGSHVKFTITRAWEVDHSE